MPKVYLSGPITGVPDFKYQFAFYANQMHVKGFMVVNPCDADQALGPQASWAEFMQYDLGLLKGCDAIAMLPGWQKSRGACIERRYAKKLGLVMIEMKQEV